MKLENTKTNSMCRMSIATVLILLVSLLATAAIAKEEPLPQMLYAGQVKVLDIGKVDRVAIGNQSVASTSILKNGQLVLLGEKPGATTMHLWLANGKELVYELEVREKKLLDGFKELAELLDYLPGTKIKKVGSQVVVEGTVDAADKTTLDQILANYPGTLNLVKSHARDNTDTVAELLGHIPDVSVKRVGEMTVIEGKLDESYKPIMDAVKGRYDKLLDLTMPKKIANERMINMKVMILEVTKNFKDSVGITWDLDNFSGPVLGFGVEGNKGASILDNSGSNTAISTNQSSVGAWVGFTGIATSITSMINLAETGGDAMIIAEPNLSARSGSSAEFLSGGEIPVSIQSTDGLTTEFKKFGIILNITPVADDQGNIMAKVETEVSEPAGEGALTTRRTVTEVSMRDKETLVISGLIKSNVTNDTNNVVGLSDIPLIGAFFGSDTYNDTRNELMILITPTIYDSGSELNVKRIAEAEDMKKRFIESLDRDVVLE